MEVLCKYYTNNARLAMGMKTFVFEKSFRFYCIEGTAIRNGNNFSVITNKFTGCVSFITDKNVPVSFMLSTNPKYKEFDGKRVNLKDIEHDNVWVNLCMLLKDKYKATGNVFKIELKGDNEVIAVEPIESDRLACSIRGIQGTVMTTGDISLENALNKCSGVRSFEYTIASSHPELEKTVSVKRSLGEMYKEISQYLKKTIVLVSNAPTGEIVEQYISTKSITEIYTTIKGNRYKKEVQPADMCEYNPFCIYLTSFYSDKFTPNVVD